MKIAIPILLLLMVAPFVSAQTTENWYKVYTGKVGNYDAVLHLHKAGINYGGYVWFMQNQWPMQFSAGYPVNKTDSISIGPVSGPVSLNLTGILTADSFIGNSTLSKENSGSKQASFRLQAAPDTAYTGFKYFYAQGTAKLPAQYKNESQCDYLAAALWPAGNNMLHNSLKAHLQKMMDIKTPVADVSKYLNDAKNKYLNGWKADNGKLSPKETAEMGLSLSVQTDDRTMVMYENSKYITLANYSFDYSGGAHGSYGTSLVTVNKQTGKKVSLAEVLNTQGVAVLPSLLDQVARLQFGIKNRLPLDQNGFLVNKIPPSENYYITSTGIGFVYSPYQIKSFADGETNLFVPFTALKAYLQAGFKY